MALSSYDTIEHGIVYTTSPHAIDPAPMYRRLAAEFGRSAFSVMLDAGPVILENGMHMMHRRADRSAVMHPGDLERVESILFDRYLTASLANA
jgi:hypothetical protein